LQYGIKAVIHPLNEPVKFNSPERGCNGVRLEDTPEELRLRLLVNAVTDYAIYMLDPAGHVSTWNPGAERVKGYTRDEIIGEHFSRFYTEVDRASDFPSRALRIAAREGRFEAEGWRVRKDGSRFWAHVIVDPIRSDDGTLLGFAKVTRDVTSKKEQETALYESEQRFRLLVQGVRDCAIYMLDTTGHISNWNAGAELIKGYTADEVIGEHFSRFYTEEDRASGEPGRALQTALGEGKYEREAWRVRKDGSLFWAHVLIDPIFDEAGEHVGFAKVTRDATERKKAQEELEETRAALAQAQKLQALGQLAGGVAHDFNNLMTVIVGAADFLRRRPTLSAEKRAQYIDAICETGARATKLTDQLLAFGRRRPLRAEVIDVNASVDALSDLLRRTLGSRVKLELSLEDTAGRVEVDAAQLDNALLNAAVNARDAMPDGGTLTISTHVDDSAGEKCVCIKVTDTGLGMPPRVLERAFDPFFTTKRVGEGTGLGLSQLHGFAAQAGGRAELASAEGEGTTVALFLPQSKKEVSLSEEANGAAHLPKGVSVLLVEDNPQVRTFANDLLCDLGCEVIAAGSAEEALDLLSKCDPQIVLSDIVMPGLSGIDLASRIAEIRPQLPVVLATGYSEQAAQGIQRRPIILKPYSAGELSGALAQALDRMASSTCDNS
jgi:PAS domain S-box-containing protein